MNTPSPHKLPKQSDLKRVCKGLFDGGANEVRLEVAGMVITATKSNVEEVIANPYDHWKRTNG